MRIVLLSFMTSLLFSSGCFLLDRPNSDPLLADGCRIDQDQEDSILGTWQGVPVPVAIEAEGFEPNEEEAIQAAISTWNNFYSTSKGFELLFLSGSDGGVKPDTSEISLLCNAMGQFFSNGSFVRAVTIYKVNSGWPENLSSAVALTQTCIDTASARITGAIMEVNFDDFFGGNQKIPDLQTIMLHEFGHLLGLDHSCSATSSREGLVSCNQTNNEEYLEAVMFPTIGFDGNGNGERKTILRLNDQERANCLYDTTDSLAIQQETN